MGPEVIIATLVPLAFFALIFGIFYIKNRENMALIERGINPFQMTPRRRPFVTLKYGLLLIGSGIGLLTAYILDNTLPHNNTPATTQIITRPARPGAASHKIVVSGNGVHVENTGSAPTDTAVVQDTVTANQHLVIKGNIAAVAANDEDEMDNENISVYHEGHRRENPAIYFALIAIGGGLGLFLSYRIEKKDWADKKIVE